MQREHETVDRTTAGFRPVPLRIPVSKVLLFGLALVIAVVSWGIVAHRPKSTTAPVIESAPGVPKASPFTPADNGEKRTGVTAHNLMLRKGPSFRIYVRWLRGQLLRTQANTNPSFDDPSSFYINIESGVLRANIGDIGNYLNAGALGASALKNIVLSGDGDQIKLTGTLHKLLPLHVELRGEIAALPDSRIRIHVTKINVLRVPFKALLRTLRIGIDDLFPSKQVRGIEVAGDDIFLDPKELLPPPFIRGHMTAVRIVNPDLEEVYGNAQSDVERVEQWRNFLHLQGGTLDFGKLTMRQVDLMLIDLSNDAWFDLDLAHYQKQLVYGYTRMTPEAGLQIFMPDLKTIPDRPTTQDISVEWMKHRNMPPPKEVTRSH